MTLTVDQLKQLVKDEIKNARGAADLTKAKALGELAVRLEKQLNSEVER
jgi:hypothetical protein